MKTPAVRSSLSYKIMFSCISNGLILENSSYTHIHFVQCTTLLSINYWVTCKSNYWSDQPKISHNSAIQYTTCIALLGFKLILNQATMHVYQLHYWNPLYPAVKIIVLFPYFFYHKFKKVDPDNIMHLIVLTMWLDLKTKIIIPRLIIIPYI